MKVCSECGRHLSTDAVRCPNDGAAPVPAPDSRVGRLVGGRFRVESRIGEGGMSVVYRARSEPDGGNVALKFLLPEHAMHQERRQRFLRELRAAQRIRHPNVIDVIDCGIEGNDLYLAMELLEGESLADYMERRAMHPAEAVEIACQIARALVHTHQLGVVHRDLKPDNIFVCAGDGRRKIKLLDFGLAWIRDEVRVTVTGVVMGTPAYMSPEQALGRRAGPATDLYSLGVLLFEMLTGELPFSGHAMQIVVAHATMLPPRVSSRGAAVPPALDAVVAKLLAKDPTERHLDATQLLGELTQLKREMEAHAGVDGPPRPVSRVSRHASGESMLTVPDWRSVEIGPGADWVYRCTLLRRAALAAHPAGSMPPWLDEAIGQLASLAEEVTRMETELQRPVQALAEREQAWQGEIGGLERSVQAAVQRETSGRRDVENLRQRLQDMREQVQAAASAFQRAWRRTADLVPDGVISTADAVEAVETLAKCSLRWHEAHRQLDELAAWRAVRAAECDELLHVLTEQRARLAELRARAGAELDGLRGQIVGVVERIAELQPRLAREWAALTAHLSEFPSAMAVLAELSHEQPRSRQMA